MVRIAVRIISHHLKTKKFVRDIDSKTIARIMNGRSCAELEAIINEAGLYTGFERAKTITMDHFMEACMRTPLMFRPNPLMMAVKTYMSTYPTATALLHRLYIMKLATRHFQRFIFLKV